jgi:hypothetical protein
VSGTIGPIKVPYSAAPLIISSIKYYIDCNSNTPTNEFTNAQSLALFPTAGTIPLSAVSISVSKSIVGAYEINN